MQLAVTNLIYLVTQNICILHEISTFRSELMQQHYFCHVKTHLHSNKYINV